MQTPRLKKTFYIFMLVIFGIVGRLVPHIPDVTPMTSLSLFAGSKFSRLTAVLFLLVTLFLSDIVLGYLNHSQLFSFWTIFSYTGFLAITFIGAKLSTYLQTKKLLSYLLISSVGFWLWVNFGVWLTASFYPKTFFGLLTCYWAALPFLRNVLCGNLIWGLVIFKSYEMLFKNNLNYIKNTEKLNF